MKLAKLVKLNYKLLAFHSKLVENNAFTMAPSKYEIFYHDVSFQFNSQSQVEAKKLFLMNDAYYCVSNFTHVE